MTISNIIKKNQPVSASRWHQKICLTSQRGWSESPTSRWGVNRSNSGSSSWGSIAAPTSTSWGSHTAPTVSPDSSGWPQSSGWTRKGQEEEEEEKESSSWGSIAAPTSTSWGSPTAPTVSPDSSGWPKSSGWTTKGQEEEEEEKEEDGSPSTITPTKSDILTSLEVEKLKAVIAEKEREIKRLTMKQSMSRDEATKVRNFSNVCVLFV